MKVKNDSQKAMKKVNKGLMDLTDAILTSDTCFFFWGEPEVPEKLEEYYKKDRNIEE